MGEISDRLHAHAKHERDDLKAKAIQAAGSANFAPTIALLRIGDVLEEIIVELRKAQLPAYEK